MHAVQGGWRLIDGLIMCAQGATIRSFAGVHALRDGTPDLPRMLRLDGRCRSRYIAGEDIIYALYYGLTSTSFVLQSKFVL